jgi:hypothetical protein
MLQQLRDKEKNKQSKMKRIKIGMIRKNLHLTITFQCHQIHQATIMLTTVVRKVGTRLLQIFVITTLSGKKHMISGVQLLMTSIPITIKPPGETDTK